MSSAMAFYDVIVILLRAAGIAALLMAAGTALFRLLFGSQLDRSSEPVRHHGARAAAVAIVLTLLHQVMMPARMTASFAGVLDTSLHSMLLTSNSGIALAVSLAGLLLLASSSRRGTSMTSGLAGVALVIVSFLLSGHTAEHDGRALLAAALATHIAVLVYWFGALIPLLSVLRHEDAQLCATVMRRFSGYAIWCVPVLLAAGLVMAWVLLPAWASLLEPYGLSLLVKLGLFCLVLVLAALNRWHLTDRLAKVDSSAHRSFIWSVRAEWLGLSLVIVVTAFMTGLFAPDA